MPTKDPYKRYDDRPNLIKLLEAFLDEKEFDEDRAGVQFKLYRDGSMLLFDITGLPVLLRDSASGRFYRIRADRVSSYLMTPYREMKRAKLSNWRTFESEVSEDFFNNWMIEKELELEFTSETDACWSKDQTV